MDTINSEKNNPVSFVLSLPDDIEKYHEILGLRQSVSMKSGLVCLQSGQEVGSHNTNNCEELLVILNGTGDIETEDKGRRLVKAGYVAYIPPNTQHNVFNIDSEPLRYIYIVSGTNKI
jgi:mannose-6-phosphate isomerase-like protein (cupin superfamily)